MVIVLEMVLNMGGISAEWSMLRSLLKVRIVIRMTINLCMCIGVIYKLCFSDRHTFINEIPSVSMYSLNSNDSYASLEEARRRLLRNEMKQKMRSPAW